MSDFEDYDEDNDPLQEELENETDAEIVKLRKPRKANWRDEPEEDKDVSRG